MMETQAAASGIDATTILATIRTVGTTHVVMVPDTHQQTLISALDRSSIPLIRAATEEQVLGICAGLWMSGNRPLALMQQLGLFASSNALRAFTHDHQVPLAIIAGMYGRNVTLGVHNNPGSAVRLCIPMLEGLGVRCVLVEGPPTAHLIEAGLRAAHEEAITSVVLLGAATT